MIGAMGVTGSGQWPAASRSAVPRVIGDFSHDAPVMLQNGEQQNRSPGVMLNTNIGGNERYDPPGENSGGGGGGGGRRGGGGDVSRPAQSTSSNGRAADLGGDPMSGFDYYGGSGGSGMGVGASPMQFVTLGNDTQRGLNASLGASLNDNDSENGGGGGGGGQNSQQQAAQSAAVREISDMSVWEKMTNHDKFKGVLMVYSDNCGHCVTTKPEFEAAARQLSSVVPFYRMNSQAAMPMLQRLGIQGVPWLAAFRGDSYSAYDGDRSANAIVQWARMSA